MKNFGAKWLALAMVVGVGASDVLLNGCGSDGPSGPGTAGRPAARAAAGRPARARQHRRHAAAAPARGGTTGSAAPAAAAGTTRHRGHRRRRRRRGAAALPAAPGSARSTPALEGFGLNMFNTGAANLFLVGLDGGTPGDPRWHDTSMGDPDAGLAEGRRAVRRLQPVRRPPEGLRDHDAAELDRLQAARAGEGRVGPEIRAR